MQGTVFVVSRIMITKGSLNMNTEKLKAWARAAGIRAAKTAAQTAVASIGAEGLISEINWFFVLSASALAGVLSLLTSVAGLPELKGDRYES